jgi:hypothetical protein
MWRDYFTWSRYLWTTKTLSTSWRPRVSTEGRHAGLRNWLSWLGFTFLLMLLIFLSSYPFLLLIYITVRLCTMILLRDFARICSAALVRLFRLICQVGSGLRVWDHEVWHLCMEGENVYIRGLVLPPFCLFPFLLTQLFVHFTWINILSTFSPLSLSSSLPLSSALSLSLPCPAIVTSVLFSYSRPLACLLLLNTDPPQLLHATALEI